MELPFVAVIVVNFNGLDCIGECLESLCRLEYDRDRREIIMVDNGSQDGSLEYVRSNFPAVKVIAMGKNTGFARANNAGFKAADSRSSYIGLVNNDSAVNPAWLRLLVETMEGDVRAGCCGAREEAASKGVAIKRGVFKGNWMGGGSVLYRRKALEEVGFFDELYFAYYEDVDLSWRLKLNGWTIRCNEEACWVHKGAGRVLTLDNRRVYLSLRNRLFLLLKFGSVRQVLLSFISYARHKNGSNSRRDSVSSDSRVSRGRRGGMVFVRKSGIAIRVAAAIAVRFPILLARRWALMPARLKIGQRQVDRWIAEIDQELFEGTYNF